MVPESNFFRMAFIFGLFALPISSSAKDAFAANRHTASAFSTSHLSSKQLRLWNEIREVVLESNPAGQPKHPILNDLWRTVEQSGRQVVVEIITDPEKSSNVAGECEFSSPETIRLKLFIPTINRVYGREQEAREGMEFVPFTGLARKSRYVKVLGHELAHLALMFRDPVYQRQLMEICTEQNAIAAAARMGAGRLSEPDLTARANRLWPMVLEVERPAVAAEKAIYQELLAGGK